MSIYTGKTKDEAMIKAMAGVCKPCCYGSESCPTTCVPCPADTEYPDNLTVTIDVSCMSAPFVIPLSRTSPLPPLPIEVVPCGDAGNTEIGTTETIVRWEGSYASGIGPEGFFGAHSCSTGASVGSDTFEGRGASMYLDLRRKVNDAGCWVQYWAMFASCGETFAGELREVGISLSTITAEGCPVTFEVNSCHPLDMSGVGDVSCDLIPTDCRTGDTPWTNCLGATLTVEITE